jgi:hypothetical protein
MDHLTALGLASNIVQFIDFTRKLFSTTRKLCVSSSGAKEEHLELETIARSIQELAERAPARNIPDATILGNKDRKLLDISNKRIEISEELLSVFDGFKAKSGRRSRDSFYQALRSAWKKDDIEELQ